MSAATTIPAPARNRLFLETAGVTRAPGPAILAPMTTSSDRAASLMTAVRTFVDEQVYAAEATYAAQLAAAPTRWSIPPIMEELKARGARRRAVEPVPARVTSAAPGSPTSSTRRCARSWAGRRSRPRRSTAPRPTPATWRCSCATARRRRRSRWLEPLLAGEIRSCFAMTEPAVASSDATNIECRIRRDGDDYVINGRKWWTSGAIDPRCKIAIVMGKTDPDAPRHLAAVDDPRADGHARRRGACARSPCSATTTRRTATPRSCSATSACRPTTSCSARAAASRSRRAGSGPGRIHHCMRLDRRRRARARADVPARELAGRVRPAARRAGRAAPRDRAQPDRDRPGAAAHAGRRRTRIDTGGNKGARKQIAMIKVVAPNMALAVDRPRDPGPRRRRRVRRTSRSRRRGPSTRTLRLADGPDEVHLESIAKQELADQLRAAGHVR